MRFSEPDTPYIGAGDSSKYGTVNDGTVRAIKSEGIYIPALLTGFIIGIIAFFILSYSISTIVINKRLQMSDDPCPGDWGGVMELGDDSVFCTAENWNNHENKIISQIQTTENRFKIEYDDWTSEYRWESLDNKPGLVVIGELYDDGYTYCQFYFAENELPDNFDTNDLFLSENSYSLEPSWCNDYSADTEGVSYSSDAPHPFLGVKMYAPMEWGYNDELRFEVTTNSSTEFGSHMSIEFVEYVIEEEIIVGIVLLFISFIIMLKIDQRRFVLKFDVEGKSMSMRRSMTSTRLGGWSWKNVNYSSASLIQERSYVSLMMNIKGQRRLVASFSGEQADQYVESLKDLLDIPDSRITHANTYDGLPTLELFDVSQWDSDRDAQQIYQFYVEKLGSTSDAKTLEELYQGAGIITLSDRVDAQKLLNHVIEVLDIGFSASEVVVHETQVVEYDELSPKEKSVDEHPESVQLDAFWTSNDSEDN